MKETPVCTCSGEYVDITMRHNLPLMLGLNCVYLFSPEQVDHSSGLPTTACRCAFSMEESSFPTDESSFTFEIPGHFSVAPFRPLFSHAFGALPHCQSIETSKLRTMIFWFWGCFRFCFWLSLWLCFWPASAHTFRVHLVYAVDERFNVRAYSYGARVAVSRPLYGQVLYKTEDSSMANEGSSLETWRFWGGQVCNNARSHRCQRERWRKRR